MPKRRKSNLSSATDRKRHRKTVEAKRRQQLADTSTGPSGTRVNIPDTATDNADVSGSELNPAPDIDGAHLPAENNVPVSSSSDSPPNLEQMSENLKTNLKDYANIGGIYDGIKCEFCGAFRFRDERPGFCCSKGQVRPPPLPDHPPELLDLYDDDQFLSHIRYYNNAFAMASLGCTEIQCDGFSPTVQIHGKVHHIIGSLKPDGSSNPIFSQIYFYDIRHELQNRASLSDKLKPATLESIQNCLHRCNLYIREIKQASQIAATVGDVNIVFSNKGPNKTYSLPTDDQIAVIAANFNSQADIIFSTLDGRLKRISEMHRMYDALHYVLFFPFGSDGYKAGLKKSNGKNMSPEDYYLYQLQIRDQSVRNNIFLRSRRLTQQFVCDQFVKMEKFRMNWIRNNQGKLRAEKYQGLLDAIDMSDNLIKEAVGRRVILPPTFYGSPRWYSSCFQDAMTIVRTFGSPDLFITMTCNPGWKEIQDSLLDGDTASDRPDLSVRVFHAKLKRLLRLITKDALFGKVAAHTCMVEYQKRGLPHAHILLIMASGSKIRSPADVNKIISAEIPDAQLNPKLFDVVSTFNIHGPCGPLCPTKDCSQRPKDDGSCSKSFPRAFGGETSINPKLHYPVYRRRGPMNGGRTFEKYVNGTKLTIDNRWVVPYSPILSEVFEAHINVEVVMSLGAVKYLYKYVTKGSDKVLFGIQDQQVVDEIENFEVGRFVSATEAFWRIYQFKINFKHPNVKKLPLHLPQEQLVYFNQDDLDEAAANGEPKTELTAYFELNQTDPDARTILYPDIVKYYTWQPQSRKWIPRKNNLSHSNSDWLSDSIGRIPIINLNPKQEELFYLRMCLHHIVGAQSFEDLRTVNGELYSTYKEACIALGVLSDDKELGKVLETAATVSFGRDIRELFATILTHATPRNAQDLWEKYKDIFVQDYIRQNGGVREIRESMTLPFSKYKTFLIHFNWI